VGVLSCDLTDVLERFLRLAQCAQAILHHHVGPSVDLGLVIVVAADDLLDRLLDDGTHLVGVEKALRNNF
jgi:hypothetical protein